MAVDLHIHSTASDGTLTPAQIVSEAKRIGLTAIAIADHDELSGIAEAQQRGGEVGLPVIPAVEISTDYEQTEAHILGYWIDPDDRRLQEKLEQIRTARVLRVERMLKLLRQIGVTVELRHVLRIAGRGSVGRPHVAAALVEAGWCKSLREAFGRYIGKNAPAYVPRVRPSVTEAIAIIKRAGGCAVLAHPGLVANRPRLLEEMRSLGVEGIEVYHPKHGTTATQRFLAQAEALGLLVTGGSDSHGPDGSYPVPIGEGDVPERCVEELKAWRRRRDG